MDRIEPINPHSEEVHAIARVYRRDAERDAGQERKRKRQPPPAPAPLREESDEPMAHHFVDEDGEHVDVRA